MPVSETVCETWESVIVVIGKHRQRLRLKDDTDEVGTNDKAFIQLNGHPFWYKGTQRFLIEAILSTNGSVHPFHFRNSTRHEIVRWFVASKIYKQH